MEYYREKGKEINRKYCDCEGKGPIMLPPAPQNTYIDVYVEENVPSCTKIDNEKRLQANYEAEVKVYRALEKLNEDIVVLHGFECTHHQYRICDTSHVRKNCKKCKKAAKIHGECDFIVISKNYFIIIEVKNMPHYGRAEISEEKTREFVGSLRKSRKQGEKAKFLIESITKHVEAEPSMILIFSAFPYTSSALWQEKDIECKNQIIWAEDFHDFDYWWMRNITDCVSVPCVGHHEEIKEILIAIWCTDKNTCDELKCSLGRSIMDVDKKLRKSGITFQSKNRAPNPNVINVTEVKSAIMTTFDTAGKEEKIDIFKDIIGVDYLTAQQVDAFKRNENLLLLNGPAGSGKTMILQAKIIQWIKANDQNRALLFIPAVRESVESYSLKSYRDTLRKACIYDVIVLTITYQKINEENDGTDTKFVYEDLSAEKIMSYVDDYHVVIAMFSKYHYGDLYILRKPPLQFWLKELQNLHERRHEQRKDIMVIVDDYQAGGFLRSEHKKFVQQSIEFSTIGRVWISFDLTQMHRRFGNHWGLPVVAARSFVKNFPSENIATLSQNLRNTSDIAGILSDMEKRILSNVVPIMDITNVAKVIPALQAGHFIHGPQIVMHVIDKKYDRRQDFSLMVEVLNNELDKLSNACLPRGGKVGIMFSGGCNGDDADVFERIAKERNAEKKMEVCACRVEYSYSSEYPVVIVVGGHDQLDFLYLAISRARVYCSVILISKRVGRHELNHFFAKETNADHALKIIRYE